MGTCARPRPGTSLPTLSYVWGQATQLRLLTSNASRLFREPISMPKTIRDALEVVRKIGERYIWVDALCIIQNSEKDLKRQLPRMGSIYGESLATIIALEETNADEDLPGVRPFTRRPIIYHEWTDLGINVAHRPSFRNSIECSRYDSRGWAYQERLLAKRCIFFSRCEVFFSAARISGSKASRKTPRDISAPPCRTLSTS